jgi:hypothetical protein
VSRLNFYGAPPKATAAMVQFNQPTQSSPQRTPSVGPQQSSFWVRNLSDEREIEIQVTAEIAPQLATVVSLMPQLTQLESGREVQINVLCASPHSNQSEVASGRTRSLPCW